ncbi:galactose mutarotase [Sphingobacterium shayense]|uniref:aldose epimerase family protein n=1 Tax=Sphingobacterium shayense TaxID=626343 RepID=UPI0015555146|nr:aldose epimerase family protein [Sphingobacterium shayense]NQD69742.1 galactose mutarotase [Sphingobacterium shayense]
MKTNILTVALIASALTFGCQQGTNDQKNNATSDTVDTTSTGFDGLIDKKNVKLYSLQNGGVSLTLTNYGARLVSLNVPDKSGASKDVILGYETAQEYKDNANNFYGAIVGRYGNRIGDATFTLDGEKYDLEKNDGKNSLHGGTNGVFNKVWDAASSNDTSVTLTYVSPDKEAGYPGTVNMSVTYSIDGQGGLNIQYNATTDKKTVLNLTNHAYFNLNGAGASTILDHQLQVDADAITAVDQTLIPTGESLKVAGTPFDFREPRTIGERINQDHAQLKIGGGYDHNFELNKTDDYQKVATVYAPETGIEMQIFTTEPGLQFYSGNFMKQEDPKGKKGLSYPFRAAFCLETQHYPDAPNHPTFASTVLEPSQEYSSKTTYRFSVR